MAMRNALRLGLLAAVALAAAASGTQQGARQSPPAQPYPQSSYVEQGQAYACTELDSPGSHSSLCFHDGARCEEQRASAENSGVRATPCLPQTPVSCFQRGGDPDPAAAVCASRPEDCDLWRLIDQDKSGRGSPACQWRQAGTPLPQR